MLQASDNESGFTTTIQLNTNHIIYSGHFPDQPVTPGVIQMQIVHELLENHFSRKLKLITMPGCKFLKILNPNKASQIDVVIVVNRIDELLNIKAWGKNEADIFFKLNSIYQFI